jgi:hypothetical protein
MRLRDDLYDALTPERAEQRVDRGFEFINRNYPQDWVYEVDLVRLNIGDSNMCIGGQLEDSFGHFQALHGVWGEEVVSLGLDTFGSRTTDVELLTAAWVRKIEAQKELLEA